MQVCCTHWVFGTGVAESMQMHESCYTLGGMVQSKQVLKNDWECIDDVIHVYLNYEQERER